MKVLIDGREVEVDESGSGTLNSSVIGDVKIDYDILKQGEDGDPQASEVKDRLNITVRNVEFYELPNSGGRGIYWYSIGGVLLMMAAALILYRKNHMGEVLKD